MTRLLIACNFVVVVAGGGSFGDDVGDGGGGNICVYVCFYSFYFFDLNSFVPYVFLYVYDFFMVMFFFYYPQEG